MKGEGGGGGKGVDHLKEREATGTVGQKKFIVRHRRGRDVVGT